MKDNRSSAPFSQYFPFLFLQRCLYYLAAIYTSKPTTYPLQKLSDSNISLAYFHISSLFSYLYDLLLMNKIPILIICFFMCLFAAIVFWCMHFGQRFSHLFKLVLQIRAKKIQFSRLSRYTFQLVALGLIKSLQVYFWLQGLKYCGTYSTLLLEQSVRPFLIFTGILLRKRGKRSMFSKCLFIV